MGAWFSEIVFTHIPREENAYANALSKLATALGFVEERNVIVTREVPQEHLMATLTSAGGGWMVSIELFLTHGIVPKNLRETWRLRRRAARCCIIECWLYKRSHWGTYLRYLTCFGLPKSIVMDHGKQLDCKTFVKFCEENGVVLRFSLVAYPQANGQAETANKSILHGLHTRLSGAKGRWVEELPSVSWAHQTTYKTTRVKHHLP
ncbi:unnamed protein product [Linum trigynum]|uniref:Integrase catalytic domain-containing protein n=1 Tax=Linum trigynum TaxID=586398 RepID=A0AAV2F3Z4_9ROSI